MDVDQYLEAVRARVGEAFGSRESLRSISDELRGARRMAIAMSNESTATELEAIREDLHRRWAAEIESRPDTAEHAALEGYPANPRPEASTPVDPSSSPSRSSSSDSRVRSSTSRVSSRAART